MKNILLIILLFTIYDCTAQSAKWQGPSVDFKHGKLKVSGNGHFLEFEDGTPFFWLGGTAWELFHRLNKKDTEKYLENRREKGFTVIQAVALAELDGLNTPNAEGEKPLINNDPAQPNEKYFAHMDWVIKKAEEKGLFIGLLPTWGDKWNKKWGVGPEIFTPENARTYGKFLGKRYKNSPNIIWILGGDRPAETDRQRRIIIEMARGLREGDGGTHLMTYHPSGGNLASDYFGKGWMDFDMCQSGHSRTVKEYNFVRKAYTREPVRPIIDGEARYEDIPDRFWLPGDHDWLDAADVRVSAYWTILSGGAGYTYGCNDIWQMYTIHRKPEVQARTDWQVALHLPGSLQMKYMRDLFTAFSWQQMVYSPNLVLNENNEDQGYILASISKSKDFIIAYTPKGRTIQLDLSKMKGPKVKAYWFNPRSGSSKEIGVYSKTQHPEFTPWSSGRGSDFVLVVMDADCNYTMP